MEQLREFEPIFRAKQLQMLWAKANNGQSHEGGGGGIKRTIDHALENDASCSVGLKRVIGDDSDEDVDIDEEEDDDNDNYCEEINGMLS